MIDEQIQRRSALARWEYEGPEKGGRVLAMDERRTVIHEPPCSPYHPDAIADGYLIAAAPEMLMALARLQGIVEAQFPPGHPALVDTQAVIDKALGRHAAVGG